MKVAF